MSDEVTGSAPNSSESPASSPSVAQPATVASEVSKVSEVSAASEAARTLAARRAEIRGKLSKDSADPKASSATAPAPVAAGTSPANATPKEAPKPDAGSDEIAALIREQRRIANDKKSLAEERAKVEAERKETSEFAPRVKAAKEALAKGSRIDAIKALFPDEDLTTGLFWDLATQMGAEGGEAVPPAAQAMDPEQLADLAIARLEAKRQAETDAAAAKKQAEQDSHMSELNEARGEYLGAVNAVFQAEQAKYPGVVRLFSLIGERANGVISERILELAEDHGRTTGNVLSVADALSKVSAEYYADMVAAAANDNNGGKPAGSVTSAWRSDAGSPAIDSKDKSLDQIREERKAALRRR